MEMGGVSKYIKLNETADGLDSNYCRNPEDKVNIYCYTDVKHDVWNYCHRIGNKD